MAAGLWGVYIQHTLRIGCLLTGPKIGVRGCVGLGATRLDGSVEKQHDASEL